MFQNSTFCDIIKMVNNMNSRMERYKIQDRPVEDVETGEVRSRVSRNNSLYNDIKTNELSRVHSNDNIKVIENNGKTIDLDKIRRYINGINNQPKSVRKSVTILDNKQSSDVKKEEEKKDYDINSVIERAKQSREIDYDIERHKKLRNTEYEILNKIKMYDNKDEDLLDNLSEEFNTDERTVIDLINTVTIHKGDVNLLEELMGNGEEDDVTDPIEKEVEKGQIKNEIIKEIEEKQEEEKKAEMLEKTQKLTSIKDNAKKEENTFFTNSMTFGKADFEGFDELEKSVKKNSVFTTILIIVLVIAIIVTLVIMANYVFELGLF